MRERRRKKWRQKRGVKAKNGGLRARSIIRGGGTRSRGGGGGAGVKMV